MAASIDIILQAYDDTAPAYESAIDNAENYVSRVKDVSAETQQASGRGFGSAMVSAALFGAKVVAVGAIVGGAAALIWKHFDTIKEAGKSAFNWIGETVGGMVDWIQASVVPGITSAIDSIIGGFYAWLDNVKIVVGGVVNALLSGDIGLAAGIVWDTLKLAWESGKDGVLGIWDQFGIALVDTLTKHMKGVLQVWNEAVNFIAKQIATVNSGLSSAEKWEHKKNMEGLNKKASAQEAAGDVEGAKRTRELAARLQSKMDEAAEAANAVDAMIDRITLETRKQIGDGTFGDVLRQKAAGEREQRQNVIDKQIAELVGKINKANDQAGPDAIANAISKIKGFAVDAWKSVIGGKSGKSGSSATDPIFAPLEDQRFITGVRARAMDDQRNREQKRDDENNAVLKFIKDWLERQVPGVLKGGVKAGVEAAKGGGVKL